MDFSWWSKLRYEVKNSSPLLLSYGVIQGGIYKHPATPPLAERSHENKRRLQINVMVASSKEAKMISSVGPFDGKKNFEKESVTFLLFL